MTKKIIRKLGEYFLGTESLRQAIERQPYRTNLVRIIASISDIGYISVARWLPTVATGTGMFYLSEKPKESLAIIGISEALRLSLSKVYDLLIRTNSDTIENTGENK